MGNTKRLVAAARALTVASLLTACAGVSGASNVSSTAAGVAPQAFDPDRTAPAAPIKGAVKGGTVTVLSAESLGGNGADLAPGLTMDPTGSYFTSTGSILSGLVTRSLTQYVYDPTQKSMVLVPDIATDLGTPNADFTQWSFTIRDGVRFENGAKVTAADVAYGIKRSFDRGAFETGPSYSNDYFLDGNTYRGPYRSGTDYAGVVVKGNTLRVKMARPFPDMPYWAAFPAMGPIPERGSDPATYWRHPLATGPYKFAKYSPGKSLTLVRNDQWDPNTDPGRHAYPDRYVFKLNRDADQTDAVILGDSAQAQTALSYDTVLGHDLRTARRSDRLTSGSGPCAFMFWPDYRKITDIRVRKALGYAFPYRHWAALAGETLGTTAIPGTSMLPPGFPGRQNYRVLDTQPGETNPEKAKALLRRAGYAPGEFRITFAYADDNFSARRKDLLVRGLGAAGFKPVPLGPLTYDELFTVLDDPKAPVNVRTDSWCFDWPSGNAWLPHLFASDGDHNNAYFAEPAVDKDMKRIGRLPLDKQPAAWGAFDKMLMKHYYPGLITKYQAVTMLHGTKIAGMNADPVYGMPTWKDIYVKQ